MPFIKVRNWFKNAYDWIKEAGKKTINFVSKGKKLWNVVGPVVKILLPDIDFTVVDEFVNNDIINILEKLPDMTDEQVIELAKQHAIEKFGVGVNKPTVEENKIANAVLETTKAVMNSSSKQSVKAKNKLANALN